jgi:PD-(D/E)XK nuclease superfamily
VSIDPFELVRAEEMLLGYSATWWTAPYDVIAVESEFDAPLVDPDTGDHSKVFRLGGKIDCILREQETGFEVLHESKTTSEDATDGSPYWLRTLMSPQLSTYMVGIRSLGFSPKKMIWDVLHRPALRPLEATPVEARKYTKATKKDPVPRLYANQRETDETPEEFRLRIRHSILENPSKYYNRGGPVMMERDELEAAYDTWHTAMAIDEGRMKQRFPRNADACSGFGNAPCTFLPVCSGGADITDPFRYRKTSKIHEELTISSSLPLLTNSQMACFRKCQRLHHYRYDLGIRAIKTTEAQRAGTLVHNGLEGWWLGKKANLNERQCLDQAFEFMRREQSVVSYLPEESV